MAGTSCRVLFTAVLDPSTAGQAKMRVTWVLESNVFSERCFDEMVDHLRRHEYPFHIVQINLSARLRSLKDHASLTDHSASKNLLRRKAGSLVCGPTMGSLRRPMRPASADFSSTTGL